MKILGRELLTAVHGAKRELRDALECAQQSFFRFPEEVGPAPANAIVAYHAWETKLALLQDLQVAYNASVAVTVDGESISLMQVIKMHSLSARLIALYERAVGKTPDEDRWDRMHRRQRTTETVLAERQMPLDAAKQLLTDERVANQQLQDAKGAGNSQLRDVDTLQHGLSSVQFDLIKPLLTGH